MHIYYACVNVYVYKLYKGYVCIVVYVDKLIVLICVYMISLFTLLDLCVSSLRRGHANILCIAQILTDDPRRAPGVQIHVSFVYNHIHRSYNCANYYVIYIYIYVYIIDTKVICV